MFADRAQIYIKSGKGETDTFPLEENYMCQMADRMVETVAVVAILFLK